MINNGFFVAVGVGAVAMNLLLVVLVLRMRTWQREIKYALALAVLDMLIPCTVLAFKGIVWMGFRPSSYAGVCGVLGAAFYVGVFSSLVLVMLVAIERYRVVFGCRFSGWLGCVLGGHVAGFFALVGVAAARGHFVSEGESLCAPDAAHGGLAQACMVAFGVSLFLLLAGTLFCYIRILFFVAATTTMDIEMSQPRAGGNSRLAPVAMRTTLICAIYFTLVTPACLALVLLGTRAIDEAGISSQVASMSLFTLSCANPFLVIFAHSATFERLVVLLSFRSSSSKQDPTYTGQ